VDLHNHRILTSHCLKWNPQILRNGLFFISMLETSAMRQLSISSFSHPSSLNMSRILLSTIPANQSTKMHTVLDLHCIEYPTANIDEIP